MLLKDLRLRHTFGLNASCRQVNFIDRLGDLFGIVSDRPHWILGEGSNCVFIDNFDGDVWVNRLHGVDVCEFDKHFVVAAASGENWHSLVQFCLSKGIHGFENLALIPGTVGAAPIQNIGAYGVEVAEFIDTVEVFDTRTQQRFALANTECQFGYRDSIFKHAEHRHWFIEKVHFQIPKARQVVTHYGELKALLSPTPQQLFDAVVDIRQSKLPDPNIQGNAGSFFKNPVIQRPHLALLQAQNPDIPYFEVDAQRVKVPAAWLIDQAGFKGRSVGGVKCHEKQPLVLFNTGAAKGADVLLLARSIQHQIKEQFDIALENEVRLIGHGGLINL